MTKHSHKQETKNGWKGYTQHHSRIRLIYEREHTTFLTMWLEKFIFCGKTIGPTTNIQCIAELLASGNEVPLGQHLLGSVYSLLHQVLNQAISWPIDWQIRWPLVVYQLVAELLYA